MHQTWGPEVAGGDSLGYVFLRLNKINLSKIHHASDVSLGARIAYVVGLVQTLSVGFHGGTAVGTRIPNHQNL